MKDAGNLASKVPQVTLGFWLTNIAATALGETWGDAVSTSMNLGFIVATLVLALVFAVVVTAQIRAQRFLPVLYWSTIAATTTVATTFADLADRSLGIGFTGGTLLLASLFAASLVLWQRALGSLSIYRIDTPRTERFYWMAIMLAQTLGMALSDWAAESMDLGHGVGAAIFGALLFLVAIAYYRTRLSHTLLFWLAFVLTRPFGAVLGGALDQPVAAGGLALSRDHALMALAAAVVLCIVIFRQRAADRTF